MVWIVLVIVMIVFWFWIVLGYEVSGVVFLIMGDIGFFDIVIFILSGIFGVVGVICLFLLVFVFLGLMVCSVIVYMVGWIVGSLFIWFIICV